jgi:hypothetical protein
MDNVYSPTPITNNGNSIFSNKNFLIAILIILLVLSFLGINLILVGGNIFETIVKSLTPLVTQIFSVFANTTGTVINKTTDVVSDTAKTGIDIAGGTLYSVGNLLKNSSQTVDIAAIKLDNKTPPPPTQLDKSINNSNSKKTEPVADSASNPIQNPITATKTQWCLVGEYQGRRGCIEISKSDKCLSGQVFPDQKACLNPTFTNNMESKPIKK